uniref:Uncharacterized protein n=1 Tax=Salix viminalis TaxID=40686 RepID=A0A6N2M3T7_SALVM
MRMHEETRSPYFRQVKEFMKEERENTKEDKMCNIFHRENLPRATEMSLISGLVGHNPSMLGLIVRFVN